MGGARVLGYSGGEAERAFIIGTGARIPQKRLGGQPWLFEGARGKFLDNILIFLGISIKERGHC